VPPTPTTAPSGAIVIGHDAYAGSLTLAQLNAARVVVSFFTHKSIGNNIIDGLRAMMAANPTRYTVTIVYSSGTVPGLNEYQVGSNGNPQSKIDGFASRVKDGHDAAYMKFCVGDWLPFTGYAPINFWPIYRNMMLAQQAEHPGTVLVWFTLPLTSVSDGRGLAGFAAFNAQVRQYVAENGGVLLDLADIESDGMRCTRNGVEALCNEWTSDGAHLNTAGQQRVAEAFWVLWAWLATL